MPTQGAVQKIRKKDNSNIHKNINKTKNILTTNKKNQQNNNTWNTKQETQIRNTPHICHVKPEPDPWKPYTSAAFSVIL